MYRIGTAVTSCLGIGYPNSNGMPKDTTSLARKRLEHTAVTAIIPTLCEAVRRERLLRAIDSLLDQGSVSVKLIIVVNGDRYDSSLFVELQKMTELRLHALSEPNVAAARRAGRELVDTEFFCFLDEDDVYLPGALQKRLAPLLDDLALDAVVGNGYRTSSGTEELVCLDMASVERNPVSSLASFNWLASCAGLYRTSSIPSELFDPQAKYLEWTTLAYRLALTKRITFIHQPTYRIHESPDSVSKSEAYRRAGPEALEKILSFEMDAGVRRELRRKYVNILHALSDYYRERGGYRLAWTYHIRSLAHPTGFFRYLAYTRKLLVPSYTSLH